MLNQERTWSDQAQQVPDLSLQPSSDEHNAHVMPWENQNRIQGANHLLIRLVFLGFMAFSLFAGGYSGTNEARV